MAPTAPKGLCFLQKSILFGLGYGLVRKTCHMTMCSPELTMERVLVQDDNDKYKFENHDRPLLYVERAVVICAHAGFSIALYPFFVAKDLAVVESQLRDIEICKEYDRSVFLLDHILS